LTAGLADVQGRIAADAANPKTLDNLRADLVRADRLRQAADRATKLADIDKAVKPWIQKIDLICTNTTKAGREAADEGDGSTEAAAQKEARTGKPTKGSWHGPKCATEGAGLVDAIRALRELRTRASDPAVLSRIDEAIKKAEERKQGLDAGWAAWNNSPFRDLAK
jgi:hypothetical protein